MKILYFLDTVLKPNYRDKTCIIIIPVSLICQRNLLSLHPRLITANIFRLACKEFIGPFSTSYYVFHWIDITHEEVFLELWAWFAVALVFTEIFYPYLRSEQCH